MIIYPAIDLKDGKCVRLYKGDMTQDTVYNDSPAAQAFEWAQLGFSWLHVVDLNGAIEGASVNHAAVKEILESVDLPVQLGGGIRNFAQIEKWFEQGVSRVILGTAAVRDPDLVKKACYHFPDQIAVALDCVDGEVMVDGWVDGSSIKAEELVKKFEDMGVNSVIYTDIERDGTGEGINIISTISLAQKTNIPIIASGGVGGIEDIQNVKDAEEYGVSGVVVGKALYEKKIDAVDALKIAS